MRDFNFFIKWRISKYTEGSYVLWFSACVFLVQFKDSKLKMFVRYVRLKILKKIRSLLVSIYKDCLIINDLKLKKNKGLFNHPDLSFTATSIPQRSNIYL